MFTRGSYSRWAASKSELYRWWTSKRQEITINPYHQPRVSTILNASGPTRTRWLWTKVALLNNSIARISRLSSPKRKSTSPWSVTKRLWSSLGQHKGWAHPNVWTISRVLKIWRYLKKTCPETTETWKNLVQDMISQLTTSLSQVITAFSSHVLSFPIDCRLQRMYSKLSPSRQTWLTQKEDWVSKLKTQLLRATGTLGWIFKGSFSIKLLSLRFQPKQ